MREGLSVCFLIPILISTDAQRQWRLISSSSLAVSFGLGGTGVFVAIFSSNFTIGRLILMENSILNKKLFDLSFLDALIIFPRGHGPAPGRTLSVVTPCQTDIRYGLCCRVDWAMRAFLEKGMTWFLRAIDDSWFNPYNLYGLIQQLESFIDPHSHIVIKSHDDPVFNKRWNMAFMQGGSPTLMSRAAVQHSLSTFLGVCGDEHWPADDVALTLIANRSFQSATTWGDVRFADATSTSAKTRFAREWGLHRPTRFRFFSKPCSSKTRHLKPLKVMIGAQTREDFRRGGI
jgi:hypothetical protein